MGAGCPLNIRHIVNRDPPLRHLIMSNNLYVRATCGSLYRTARAPFDRFGAETRAGPNLRRRFDDSIYCHYNPGNRLNFNFFYIILMALVRTAEARPIIIIFFESCAR